MNIIQPIPRITTALVAALLLSIQSIHAAPATWNNAAGGNWSVGGNWSPSGVPGNTSDVIFGTIGSGSPNTMDVSALTVNSLAYDWLSGLQQTTVINPGQTLTVTGSGAAGTPLLLVGSSVIPLNNTTFAPAAITGGGNLVVSGLGNIVVRIGVNSGAAAANHMATLDLSGLNNFTANAGRLLIGQALTSETFANRPSGTLILAATNNITLTGAIPQVMVQDGGQNANGGTASVLTFGQVNFLNADIMRLGGQKGNANLNFNAALTAPSLKIRNADGVSPSSTIDFGYNSDVSTGNSTVLVADFGPGSVDLSANLVNIPQGPIGTGTGSSSGTVTLGAGDSTIGTLEIGFGRATGASGTTTGTLNVNNNGLFGGSGATVNVSTSLRLARTNGGSATVNGTLNITGGKVQANTILAGGGVSTINLNSASPSSTLVVTNSAGSLASPIRNFSMSDATLTIPALNGGASVAVSNLTVGGSANTINVSTIPAIGSYPADFTLINYLGGYTAGTGPLSLGPLPPASPAYVGALVDTGGGVIKLHLTAGPVANLAMRWTGATDNNWDLTTYNWTFLALATNFFNGSSPNFDDSTTQSNVFLATAVSPGNITVSNNLLQYSFVGSGNIAGAASLTKRGSKTLIVANEGIDTISTVVISGGTLQIGTNDLNGEISAINITNNSALVVNRSGSYTLSAAIAGTGTVTKSGDGKLILSGANSYSGTTTLSGGTLQIDGTSSGTGALTTSVGTVLAGGGTVSGAVTVGGQMNPGSSTATGVFNANGGLTLNSGSTLNFDLSATDPSNPAVNDSINVVGNLNLNNNKITVSFNGSPVGGTYTLFTYTGSLIGSFNPTIAGTHFTATLDTSNPGIVYLNISGAGADLKWNSASDTAWDSVATDWFNLGSSLPSVFYSGDSALLDDTAGVVAGITIASGVNVSPSIITDTATNNSFSISGAGHITGSASIVKSGLATFEISTANTFTGPVDVQRGTLRTGNAAALGTTASGTTVQDGATLDLNGQNLGGETITISGAGDGGVGALVNYGGAAPVQALRTLILAGDATVGGAGLLAMNNSGGAASLAGAFSLTKVGGNQFTLQNLTTVDAGLQNIHIQQGTMEFSGSTPGMGDPAFTNTVEAGATLSLSQNGVTWNKQFVFNGNGVTTTLNVANSASPTLDGSVELHGDCVFNVGSSSLTINPAISGDGWLIKSGGSPLILNGVNTYTGDTLINAAALRLNGTATINNSTNVIIASGATLTVTGRVDSTFTLASGQSLKGNGVVNGHVAEVAGSTIAPGVDAIGALTVSNTIVLSGQTVMELDEAGATNDFLRCNQSITYGGTLNLVNLGGPLSSGATFKLFSASSYLGSFSSINPPTPGAGQTWDLTGLNNGVVKVAGAGGPKLNFGVTNGVISMSWPAGYKLIWQTNALTKGLSTNWVDYPNTSNPINITISPSIPTAFFGLKPQ